MRCCIKLQLLLTEIENLPVAGDDCDSGRITCVNSGSVFVLTKLTAHVRRSEIDPLC